MTEHHVHGPSHTGSVVLDLGGDIGVLILDAPRALLHREIEISRVDGGREARRTHSMVRERVTAAGVSYAALYVSVRAGDYVVWDEEDTPVGTATVRGGDISHFSWGSRGGAA